LVVEGVVVVVGGFGPGKLGFGFVVAVSLPKGARVFLLRKWGVRELVEGGFAELRVRVEVESERSVRAGKLAGLWEKWAPVAGRKCAIFLEEEFHLSCV
jgi:hypothetical protein